MLVKRRNYLSKLDIYMKKPDTNITTNHNADTNITTNHNATIQPLFNKRNIIGVIRIFREKWSTEGQGVFERRRRKQPRETMDVCP